MPGPGLAQLVRRPKGRAYPAAQPIRVDAQRLTGKLERERAVPVAALDPGEVASERTGAPVARGEQAPQAVLEDREPEQELTGQRPAAEADGHAAPPRLVGRLTATASQLADAWRAYRSDVSPVDGPIHGFPSAIRIGTGDGYVRRSRRMGASAAESNVPATSGRTWKTPRCSSSSVWQHSLIATKVSPHAAAPTRAPVHRLPKGAARRTATISTAQGTIVHANARQMHGHPIVRNTSGVQLMKTGLPHTRIPTSASVAPAATATAVPARRPGIATRRAASASSAAATSIAASSRRNPGVCNRCATSSRS